MVYLRHQLDNLISYICIMYSGKLVEFFNKKNINITEGYSQLNKAQCLEIISLINNEQTLIMEIGFNAGHSAELFLENSKAYVYSFDLGTHFHQYLKYGKKYINNTYPNRHTLVFGDSRITVPKFAINNSIEFDIIFIDGGHDYEIAYADLINCKKLANKNTILIMDDTIKNNKALETSWTIGPTKAWNECIKKGIITETSTFNWAQGHGMSVGKYLF